MSHCFHSCCTEVICKAHFRISLDAWSSGSHLFYSKVRHRPQQYLNVPWRFQLFVITHIVQPLKYLVLDISIVKKMSIEFSEIHFKIFPGLEMTLYIFLYILWFYYIYLFNACYAHLDLEPPPLVNLLRPLVENHCSRGHPGIVLIL